MNQKGWIAPVIMLVILIIGLFVGLQLLKNTQILKSKASLDVITFSGPSVQTDSTGTKYLTNSSVIVDITSPFGPPLQKVLGVSTEKKSFWEEFINTFLVSLKLKKAEEEKIDKAIDISVLPVAKKLTPPDTLSPGSQASFKTPLPIVKTPQPTPIEVLPKSKPAATSSAQPEVEATIGFKIAESPIELEVKSFLTYASHPMHLNFVFSSSAPGVKTIFVQFQNNKGQTSQVFTKSIELKSPVTPSPSPTLTPFPSATSTVSPSPSPSASAVVPAYSPSPSPQASASPNASSTPTPAASATPSPSPGT